MVRRPFSNNVIPRKIWRKSKKMETRHTSIHSKRMEIWNNTTSTKPVQCNRKFNEKRRRFRNIQRRWLRTRRRIYSKTSTNDGKTKSKYTNKKSMDRLTNRRRNFKRNQRSKGSIILWQLSRFSIFKSKRRLPNRYQLFKTIINNFWKKSSKPNKRRKSINRSW